MIRFFDVCAYVSGLSDWVGKKTHARPDGFPATEPEHEILWKQLGDSIFGNLNFQVPCKRFWESILVHELIWLFSLKLYMKFLFCQGFPRLGDR